MSRIHHLHSESLSLTVLETGCTLAAVRFGSGQRNLVLGFADPDDHQHIPVCAGALVGPVANRVSDGLAHVDGQTFQMECNEDGQTALHSGSDGLHVRDWSTLFATGTELSLQCQLPDGACGLPGNRCITATYAVHGSAFTLTLMAVSDAVTPMNIAAHPYWNLDGLSDILTHSLQVMAEAFLPVDPLNLPTGQIAPVAGTAFDFSQERRLSRDPALDVNFCLGDNPVMPRRPAARLRGRDGTTLVIETTAPGLQVYAGAHLPALPAVLEGGKDLRPFGAIALEPQMWPDAMAHAHFPPILLRPGQTWWQETRFHLSQDENAAS